MKNKKGALTPLLYVISVIFWISVWWVAAAILNKELVLPSPVRAFSVLISFTGKPSFWKTCLYSLGRVLGGFVLGVALGSILGALSHIKAFDALFAPLMTVIRCVPVASFIILVWYFLDKNTVPLFTAFLMVCPVMWQSVKSGMASVDPGLRAVGKVYGFSFGKRLLHIWLPPVRSHFLSGANSSLGLAWKAGVAAEVLCQPLISIGKEIYLTKNYLETAELFAWTLVVVIFSLALESLLKLASRRQNDRDKKYQ